MKVAVIGCGHWGKNLVRNFAELDALSAISDPDKDLANKLSRDYGVPALSFDEVLSSDCDGIIIAAPAPLHAELAIKAFHSGKHVYVEKPLAMTLEDADKIIDASIQAKCHLMVGHLLQYHPIFVELRKRVENGEIGELKYLYSNRLSLGKVRSEEDVVWSFAPHDISMLLSLANDDVSSVNCEGTSILQEGIVDMATLHLQFISGLRAHISCSWLHPVKEQKLIVIGDQGMAIFDDTLEWNKKLALYRHSIDSSQNPPLPKKAEPEFIDVPEGEPLQAECKYFLRIIAGDAEPRTDGPEGRAVLNVLSAATCSMITGGKVDA